ncbi:hypothetical protein O3Q51_17145 [Cryomorphaceae bacterium 1068]|nr:hypothetical protein [Cryomorphaceae bacterium 1068]
MKTNHLASIVKTGILALSCTVFLASCTKETQEVVEPLYTLGDPKSPSPQGSRTFEVSSFVLAGEEQASSYQEIEWTFMNNGTVIASSPNQEWPGTWNVGQMDGVQKLFLNFPDAPPLINALSGIWTVVSLDLNNPQFINDAGDTLQIIPTGETVMSLELQALNAFLLDSVFVVADFVYQGNDVTSTFSDVSLDFKGNNVVTAERFGQQRGGQWMTSETQDGIVLTIQFNPPPAPLTGFNAAWDVVSFSDTEIVLEDVDGPPDTGSYLIITMEN